MRSYRLHPQPALPARPKAPAADRPSSDLPRLARCRGTHASPDSSAPPRFTFTLPPEGSFEFRARRAQPRVDGIQVQRQSLRDFWSTQLLQLAEHEHFSLLLVELSQQRVEQQYGFLELSSGGRI